MNKRTAIFLMAFILMHNPINYNATNPKSGKPLVGNHKEEFSPKLGNASILYEIDTVKRIVFVLTVKNRKHVY